MSGIPPRSSEVSRPSLYVYHGMAHNYTYGLILRRDDEHLAHSQDWVEVITLNTHC